jgi:hypothetical protein
MISCVHRWQLQEGGPFAGLLVCEWCHAVIRAALATAEGHLAIDLQVLSYGHSGVGLEDLDDVLVWLRRQLARPERSVKRHKRRKVA